MKKLMLATFLLVVGSCAKNKNENNPIENKNYSIETKEKVNEINNDFTKIYMSRANSLRLSEYRGVIIKKVNDIYSGCAFIYDTEGDSVLNEINEFKSIEVNNNNIFYSCDRLTLDGHKLFMAKGEMDNKILRFQFKFENNSEWGKSYTEYDLVNDLPVDAYVYLPKLNQFLNEKNSEKVQTTKDLPSYSEIRGTLIQETNILAIKELLGEPDETFNKNTLEWYVYFFAVQKNGEVGHLAIRFQRFHPQVIDEVTFYTPGDKVKLGYSYFISPSKFK